MKTKHSLGVLFTISLLFVLVGISFAGPGSAKLDTPFKIQFGEEVKIGSENMVIAFKDAKVTRCPSGAMCFVPDNVFVLLEVSKTSKPTLNLRVNNRLGSKSTTAYKTYQIKLLKLEPMLPKAPAPYKEKDFAVSLNVSKVVE